MELLPEIKNRFSVTSFQEDPIPEDALERILEAGRVSPSAKNRQPWRFVMIVDPKTRRAVAEASYDEPHVHQAQAILAVCSTNIDYKMPNGQLAYPVDLTWASAFMLLQAEHEGLGTCIITTYREELIKEILTIPHSMRVVSLLLLGYSAEKDKVRDRLPLDRVSSYDHW